MSVYNKKMDLNRISQKKKYIPISEKFRGYLRSYGREQDVSLKYEDLLRYREVIPLVGKDGESTLWETVFYDPREMEEINQDLVSIYSKLKASGYDDLMEHLYIERIDLCSFGNSQPFRIRIVNRFNDNYDHFYIKRADANRVYGLELEDQLSPSRIHYLTRGETLVEEHIAGIPGDTFIDGYFGSPNLNKVRIAKEFIKFNERCFVRLLGDMRSYNYVVEITPDFEEEQYRVRPMDFDQQSYEGSKSIYLPEFFPENRSVVNLCMQVLNPQTIKQYQQEERSKIAYRYHFSGNQIESLLDTMCKDTLSGPEKIHQLRDELAQFHHDRDFLECESMGEIVRKNLQATLFPNGPGCQLPNLS